MTRYDASRRDFLGTSAAIGEDASVMEYACPATRIIDAEARRLIGGLNDSHTHPIRGGLN